MPRKLDKENVCQQLLNSSTEEDSPPIKKKTPRRKSTLTFLDQKKNVTYKVGPYRKHLVKTPKATLYTESLVALPAGQGEVRTLIAVAEGDGTLASSAVKNFSLKTVKITKENIHILKKVIPEQEPRKTPKNAVPRNANNVASIQSLNSDLFVRNAAPSNEHPPSSALTTPVNKVTAFKATVDQQDVGGDVSEQQSLSDHLLQSVEARAHGSITITSISQAARGVNPAMEPSRGSNSFTPLREMQENAILPSSPLPAAKPSPCYDSALMNLIYVDENGKTPAGTMSKVRMCKAHEKMINAHYALLKRRKILNGNKTPTKFQILNDEKKQERPLDAGVRILLKPEMARLGKYKFGGGVGGIGSEKEALPSPERRFVSAVISSCKVFMRQNEIYQDYKQPSDATLFNNIAYDSHDRKLPRPGGISKRPKKKTSSKKTARNSTDKKRARGRKKQPPPSTKRQLAMPEEMIPVEDSSLNDEELVPAEEHMFDSD